MIFQNMTTVASKGSDTHALINSDKKVWHEDEHDIVTALCICMLWCLVCDNIAKMLQNVPNSKLYWLCNSFHDFTYKYVISVTDCVALEFDAVKATKYTNTISTYGFICLIESYPQGAKVLSDVNKQYLEKGLSF